MIRAIVLAVLFGTTACTPALQGNTTTLSPASAVQCHVMEGKADRRCTPGALNPDVTQDTIHQTICIKGWTATVRPPVSYTDALKRKQMVQYGETGSLSGYEEDHEINLGIGGAPYNPANIWPEPRTDSHPAAEKDKEEVYLQRRVCTGTVTLAAAQAKMFADWSHS